MAEKDCLNCGDTITRTYETDERWKNRKYCSQSCQMDYEYNEGERDPKETTKKAQKARRKQGLKRFEENPTTKISKRGYRCIYIPSSIAQNHDDLESGWLKMHHYVWWKEKGELPPVDDLQEEGNGVVMHHKDGDKLNNSIDNLELMKNGEHVSMHAESD